MIFFSIRAQTSFKLRPGISGHSVTPWGSGGSRSSASQNFSSLGGGTAAANAKYEEHEACAASNSAVGENRLHREKMRSHFPSLSKSMVQVI